MHSSSYFVMKCCDLLMIPQLASTCLFVREWFPTSLKFSQPPEAGCGLVALSSTRCHKGRQQHGYLGKLSPLTQNTTGLISAALHSGQSGIKLVRKTVLFPLLMYFSPCECWISHWRSPCLILRYWQKSIMKLRSTLFSCWARELHWKSGN